MMNNHKQTDLITCKWMKQHKQMQEKDMEKENY